MQQEISNIRANVKNNPVSANGSFGASTVFYSSQNIAARRDPFYWVLRANLTIKVLDKIDVPFSAVITQQDKNFTSGLDKFSQPFNQFGISPKYKWLTVHAGYRSLEFSQYSLSGAIFLGGGFEVKPTKSFFQVSALHGRFVKAVPKGGVAGVVVSVPAYERKGTSAKLRLGKENNFCDLVFMRLYDVEGSVPYDTAIISAPVQNQVLAITTRQKLSKKIQLSGEWAYSMFTGNIYQEVVSGSGHRIERKIFPVKASTSFNQATHWSLEYNAKKYSLGLAYKRIDPDYRSLGAIFLTNDVEESSASLKFNLLKNKLTAGFSGGLQRNNLDKIQTGTTRRLISSGDLNYQPNDVLQFGLNFSGFSSNTIPIRNVFTDSIQLVQVTQSSGLNSNYRKEFTKHQLILAAQILRQLSTINKDQGTELLSSSISANWLIKKWNLNFQMAMLYNKTSNTSSEISGLGPSAGLSKTALKNRLRIGYTIAQQNILEGSQKISSTLSQSLNSSFRINEKQSLRLDANYLQKNGMGPNVISFSEWRGSLSYQYTFSAKKKTKKI